MDSSDENSKNLEEVKLISKNLIPKKSSKKYKLSYRQFLKWQKENNNNSLSESALLAYFIELAEKMKSSSLWSQYSMLRANLNIYNDTDISKYGKLKTFLKRKSDGYCPKKAKIFTAEEINRFLNEAPDHAYLLTKVVMIMGITCGCRKEELYNMQINQITHMDDGALIEIPQTNMKLSKKFTIKGIFYETVKKYLNLHPQNGSNTYLFLNYQKGKCKPQRVGINKIGHMGKKIAEYLNLPNPHLYTGHCFRRSSATILVDHCNVTSLERHGKWKVAADKEIAIEDPLSDNNENIKNLQISIDSTQPDLSSENSIPERSKKKYQITYNQFLAWQTEKQENSLSENVLLSYFVEQSQKLKSSSLWSHYSMLRASLNMYNNADISKYTKLKAFLRENSEGYSPKKSNSFTAEEVNTFLNGAPDSEYLLIKVVMIMGITCGCRKDELYNMQIDHITHIDNKAYLIEIPQTTSETTKKFIVKGNLYDIVKKYIDLRPLNINNTYFFVNYRKDSVQRVGINKIGGMGKRIAEFLELPNPHLYTGFCFRRSSATILADSCANITSLEKHSESTNTSKKSE